jgi:hypothetical protein
MGIHAHWRGDLAPDRVPLTLCDRRASETAGDFAILRIISPAICVRCDREWRRLVRGAA